MRPKGRPRSIRDRPDNAPPRAVAGHALPTAGRQPGVENRTLCGGQTMTSTGVTPATLITVDVESDWGSGRTRGIREILPRMLDLLDRFGVRVTFFTVGELARDVRTHLDPGRGHEVASHGLTHARLDRLSTEEAEYEIAESRRQLCEQGYDVTGFRAPFLRDIKELPALLSRSGYVYDSSMGSTLPSLRHLVRQREVTESHSIARIPPTTLRDRITPYSLTALRVRAPLMSRPCRSAPTMFYCHLHEFLNMPNGDGGWAGLPSPLRRLHARNTGDRAWRLFEDVLDRHAPRAMTCREFVDRLA